MNFWPIGNRNSLKMVLKNRSYDGENVYMLMEGRSKSFRNYNFFSTKSHWVSATGGSSRGPNQVNTLDAEGFRTYQNSFGVPKIWCYHILSRLNDLCLLRNQFTTSSPLFGLYFYFWSSMVTDILLKSIEFILNTSKLSVEIHARKRFCSG